jgi:hypothetical protein
LTLSDAFIQSMEKVALPFWLAKLDL